MQRTNSMRKEARLSRPQNAAPSIFAEGDLSRRKFLGMLALGGTLAAFSGRATAARDKRVMTVKGPVAAGSLGRVLSHEHILVDFIGATDTGYHRWKREEVIRVVEPKLVAVREAGFQTLFECTPAYLGRDPRLLTELSDRTQLHIVTNTGYYGARENKFLPPHAFNASAEALSDEWIREWQNGIEDTGVRPGFIKIGLDQGPLSPMHRKLVRAAAMTHRATGLTIASHTGTAPGALEALDILDEEGVAADAFVWVHAQAEENIQHHITAAGRGCWISLDGIQDDNISEYVDRLVKIRTAGYLGKVLISQDAGWYSPGEKDGGSFRSYLSIAGKLLPVLGEKGFTDKEIAQLLHDNVVEAFGIRS